MHVWNKLQICEEFLRKEVPTISNRIVWKPFSKIIVETFFFVFCETKPPWTLFSQSTHTTSFRIKQYRYQKKYIWIFFGSLHLHNLKHLETHRIFPSYTHIISDWIDSLSKRVSPAGFNDFLFYYYSHGKVLDAMRKSRNNIVINETTIWRSKFKRFYFTLNLKS